MYEIHPASSVYAAEPFRLLAHLTEHGFSRRLFVEYLSCYTQYKDQATGWMIQGLVPGRSNRFYCLQMSNPAVAPTQPIKWVLGLLCLEVKQVGREADHQLPFIARLRMSGVMPLLNHMPSWHGQG